MIPATTPDELLDVAEALAERGARGFLLSGGVDERGKIPLEGFVPAITEIKSSTDLRINAHVGLAPRAELESLVGSGIDSFSVDLYGSDETVREVLGLDAKSDDYFQVFETLQQLGATVSPHLCVGIHAGELKGEASVISRLRQHRPKTLILISLIPTKGTQYAGVKAPSREMMLSVIGEARAELPETKLLLGCMRSKADRSWESDLVDAGLDGIVLPAQNTVESLRAKGYSVRKRSVCCALI
jgi:uncharacterized radical SAM superfamily protein